MKEKRTSGAMEFAAAAILLVVPFATYIAGYYLRCGRYSAYIAASDPSFHRSGSGLFRVYPTEFEALIFRPAARIEKTLAGREVNVEAECDPDDLLEVCPLYD